MQNLTKYFFIVPHKPSIYNCKKLYQHNIDMEINKDTDLCRIKLNQLVH